MERLRPQFENLGAALELHGPPRDVRAWFDRDALHQVLQNLVDNAEKYTRDAADRTVRVTVEPGERPAVAVCDQGPGIPAEVRRRLFRPFSRGRSTEKPAGLGIGLTLVRELCRAQGATVELAGGAGRGTTFRITFRGVHEAA